MTPLNGPVFRRRESCRTDVSPLVRRIEVRKRLLNFAPFYLCSSPRSPRHEPAGLCLGSCWLGIEYLTCAPHLLLTSCLRQVQTAKTCCRYPQLSNSSSKTALEVPSFNNNISLSLLSLEPPKGFMESRPCPSPHLDNHHSTLTFIFYTRIPLPTYSPF